MVDAAPEGFTDAQWHVDAIADTGVGYTAIKGWRVTCAWCSWEVTTPTKGEGLTMYREHERQRLEAHNREQADPAGVWTEHHRLCRVCSQDDGFCPEGLVLKRRAGSPEGSSLSPEGDHA